MKKQFLLYLTIGLLYSASGSVQSRQERSASKPSQPAAIEVPTELLQQLMRDDAEARNFVNQGLVTDEPGGKFMADLADLNEDGKSEYIVSPPNLMMGNSSGPKWVYRRTPKGYQLLLSIGAMGLSPLKTLTHGYHDLEAIGGGNAMGYFKGIYKFNGSKYVYASKRNSKNPR